MAIDVERVRAETPGVQGVIHLNSAGAALPPQQVIDAVRDYYDEEVICGGYETAERRLAEVEATYDALAALIGAKRREIAVLDNATRAWDMAFYSLTFAEGDRILTTTTEYAANYIAYLQVAGRTGAVIDVIPDMPNGEIDVAALVEMLDERVKLISINHVPTNSGLVNPAAAVGRVARDAGVPYLLDACQSVGQMPIDVDDIGCDFLTATSRKFLRGPRGMGFLYVGERMLERVEPVMLDLFGARWLPGDRYETRPDARRFELWEQNLAAKVGLAAAVRYAMALGLDDIWDRVKMLADQLRKQLDEISGVTVRDLGTERCGIVTFTVEGHEAESVRTELRDRSINVSVATPWSARLDMDGRGLEGVVRASVHYYNATTELDAVVGALVEIGCIS